MSNDYHGDSRVFRAQQTAQTAGWMALALIILAVSSAQAINMIRFALPPGAFSGGLDPIIALGIAIAIAAIGIGMMTLMLAYAYRIIMRTRKQAQSKPYTGPNARDYERRDRGQSRNDRSRDGQNRERRHSDSGQRPPTVSPAPSPTGEVRPMDHMDRFTDNVLSRNQRDDGRGSSGGGSPKP